MGQPTTPAEPTAEPSTPPATPAEPATGDGLGEAGKKALDAERAARKALEAEVKALKERDPVKEVLAKLGQTQEPGTDPVAALAERVTKAEERAAKAELENMRNSVRDAKGLTPAQAAELVGATRDDLEAHADRLLAAFPASTTAANGSTPGTPAPDPSQGARGGGADLHAALTAARSKGDVMESIRLQGGLLDAARAKQQ